MVEFIWTFLVGVVASVLSGIAGGGGGLISAPFFILIGLPPQIAVATTKFGSLGLTLGSIAKFRKTDHIRRDHVIYLSVLSVIAALLGARLLLASSNELVERLVGFIMIGSLPFLFMKDVGLSRFRPGRFKEVSGYISYFFVLVLQAAFGAGIGMMLMIVMIGLLGFTALESSATRRIPGLILAVTALSIYIFNDLVSYGHGIAMLAGMFLGGYIGTHIAIKKGNAFVKAVFAITVFILGIKLLIA